MYTGGETEPVFQENVTRSSKGDLWWKLNLDA